MYFLIILAIVASLAGCQTDTLKNGVSSPVPSAAASNAIILDMVDRFSEANGPQKGIIVLPKGSFEVSQSLAAALKERGYVVSQDQDAGNDKAAATAVFAMETDSDRTLARLSTKTVQLARAYTTTRTSASPLSPLSVMQR